MNIKFNTFKIPLHNSNANAKPNNNKTENSYATNKLKNHKKPKASSDSVKIKGKYKNISIKITFQNKIWIIKISRPEVENAIDRETATELNSVFKEFDHDKNSLVAILSGKGKSFCSGADLKNISDEIESLKQSNSFYNESNNQSKQNSNLKINEISEKGNGPLGISRLVLNKPIIAAVNGPAVGGGLELLLWCDLRVAYRNCEMGLYCRKRGVPLIDGGTYRLTQMVGLSRALDLVLTGRKIDGNEAFKWGLINRICDDRRSVMKEAKKLAVELCALPQDCLRNDRMSLLENAFNPGDLQQKIKTEFDYGLKSLRSIEMKIAVDEFLKKKNNKKMLPKF
jgi:enoyl-CoA hydratase